MPNRNRIGMPGKRGAAYEPLSPEVMGLEITLARLAPDCGTYDELAIRAKLAGASVPLPRVRLALCALASDLSGFIGQFRDEGADAIDAAQATVTAMRPSAQTRIRRAPYVRTLRQNAGDFATLLAATTALFQVAWGDNPAWDVSDGIDDDSASVASAVVRTFGLEPSPAQLNPGIAELIQVDTDLFSRLGILPLDSLPDTVSELTDNDLDAAFDLVRLAVEHPQAVLVEIKSRTGVSDPRLSALIHAFSTNPADWKSSAGLVVIVATVHHRLRSQEVVRRVPDSAAELDALVSLARRMIDDQAAA